MTYIYDHLTVPQLEERVRNMDIYGNEETFRLYTFFKANVKHFMPNTAKEKLEQAFKEVCLHQHLSWKDLHNEQQEEQPTISGIEPSFIESVKARPGVICTYHLGSYRMINKVLSDAEIRFSLLVNANVFEEESKQEVSGGFVRDFDLIDAEQPTALLKMMRALKKGESLLVYLDGNTGVNSGKEKHVVVEFMAGRLWVRKGIAVLAQLMQCPIYPLSCLRTSLYSLAYSTAEAIIPPKDKQPDPLFVQRTMQTLYKQLEEIVYTQPFQWECWLYLHQFMVLPEPVKSRNEVQVKELLNPDAWASFSIDGHCFALDLESFSSFKIAEPIHTMMKGLAMSNG